MEPHAILHIGLEYVGRKRNTRVHFLRQTFDSINYKTGHPKCRFVGSNYKKQRQRVESLQ